MEKLESFIAAHFDDALAKGHIIPYYQPVIRTISKKLCSFEALARWVDPERGVISPGQFIPVLENNHVIHRLDACIIRQVCATIRRTVEAGEIPIPVSVNLSRLDFALCDIFTVVDDIVSQYQIPHDFLYIEITESVMAEQEDAMRDIVARFHAAGYQVWMDDFGSAYSSLNLLKDFEFDELKMDMRFLSSFNQRSRRIMNAVIQMAKEIDIHTLAEGVETEEQLRYLRNIGCEKVQGYYFGRPMPFDEALAHMRALDISVERPQDRRYYDEIGKVNFLSAVPFMTKAERDRLRNARQLNSIPLAVAEGRRDSFSILFYNTAFEQTAESTGMASHIFTQEMLRVPQPYSLLPKRLLNLMESTRSGEEGRMYFISNDEYYEIQAKCIAQTKDAYSVLFRMSNLSKASQSVRTDHLDDSIRQIYTLFERITLVDTRNDTITPLYIATREDLLSGRHNVKTLAREYAERLIFPEDREAYRQLMDFDSIEHKLREAGCSHISRYLRARAPHGRYEWKHYILMRMQPNTYVLLMRNVHSDLVSFLDNHHLSHQSPEGEAIDSPELLWRNLIQSDITRLFWKDRERRFLGASTGFLSYYGFGSAEEIIGRTDEDLGWHIHPEGYMNDELRVIREGMTTHNIPGRCISNGENRDIIASKAPLYDRNGEVQGLIGCFIDRELLSVNDIRGKETKRRDMLTGLLNSRGIAEEAYTFQDEYELRNVDFVRMHVAIDDFSSLNTQYGFDFGDKAISALGAALKKDFGLTCAVGRYTGHEFVILHQIQTLSDAGRLRARVKEIAGKIREIDGIALTLYLSAGYCVYSECEDLETQKQRAEIRLLADHDDHSTIENLKSRASGIFHLYDDLPILYCVCRVVADGSGRVRDGILFYANRAFERHLNVNVSQMLGRRFSELFGPPSEAWCEIARRAALEGESVAKQVPFGPSGRPLYVTASPVIHPGYCCFTCMDVEGMK